MITNLLGVIAPILVCTIIGFVWDKRGLPYDVNKITPLIVNVGTPCLVVSTLLKVEINLQDVLTIFKYAVLVHVLALLIGFAAIKLTRQDIATFLPSMFLPNNGNMGLPVCLFAFGDAGLALAIAFFAISAVTQFTAGAAIASGNMQIREVLAMPLLWGVVIALTLIGLDQELPTWLFNSLNLVGAFPIPMMLIGLGVSLSRLSVSNLPIAFLFSAVRVGGGCFIGWGIAEFFALEGVLRGVIIVQAAMPVALFNYLFAAYYHRNAGAVAGMVVTSTAMSFLTLPFVLWLGLSP